MIKFIIRFKKGSKIVTLIIQLSYFLMEQQTTPNKNQPLTLSNLIDEIQFTKPKPRKKKTISDCESLSSTASLQSKDKSKSWTAQEEQFFQILLKNYGTDFSIMNMFFPKKTKNQIKNKYKQKHKEEKKEAKKYDAKLEAIKTLFRQADQHQEDG